MGYHLPGPGRGMSTTRPPVTQDINLPLSVTNISQDTASHRHGPLQSSQTQVQPGQLGRGRARLPHEARELHELLQQELQRPGQGGHHERHHRGLRHPGPLQQPPPDPACGPQPLVLQSILSCPLTLSLSRVLSSILTSLVGLLRDVLRQEDQKLPGLWEVLRLQQ